MLDVLSRVRDGFGALRLALSERDILARNFVERDQHVIRRYTSGCGDARVDVFQKGKPCLLRPPLDESDVEEN